MARLRRGIALASAAVTLAVLVVVGGAGGASGVPSVHLWRSAAPPRADVGLSGRGFPAGSVAAVRFDGRRVGSVTIDGDGALVTKAHVPAEALPGEHEVAVTEGSLKALTSLLVRADWPMARGSAHARGVNFVENLLSPANVGQLQLKWQADAGTNFTSPATVAGGLVFSGDFSGADLHAIDATTGKDRWTFHLGDEGTGLDNAPAVVGGVAYVQAEGSIIALDAATGAFRWLWNGAANYAPPIVSNGVVYTSGSSPGQVAAIDATSGKQLWESGGRPGCGAGFALSNGLVITVAGAVVAFDAVTGAQQWSTTLPGGDQACSGVAAAGTDVYVGSEQGHLYDLDAPTGKILWISPQVAPGPENGVHVIRDSPVVGTDTVYASNQGDGVLYAFRRADGSINWTADAHVTKPPVLANGVIYTMNFSVLRLTDAANGASLGTVAMPARTATDHTPTVVNGVVYASGGGGVEAFALPGQ